MATFDLFKATWSGTLGTEEIFSYQRFVSCAVSPTDQGAVGDEIEGDVANMLGQAVLLGPIATISQGFGSDVAWTQLKVSPWDAATNKLVVGEIPDIRALSEVGTGASGDTLPYAVAFAITTRSSILPSAKDKNRFYLPPMTSECSSSGNHMDQTVIDALSLWLSLGQTAYQTSGVTDGYINYSPTDHAAKIMVDHYIGSRWDTIRRRGNHVVEARTIGPM